jgi:hypothetical protein
VVANPWGVGTTYRPATAAESYQRGFADVVRAGGERNVNNSIAAGNFQDAYSKQLDNRLKSVDTYWARREAYDQRQAERAYARAQEREAYFAQTLLKPMSDNEFDATSGRIQWPMLCREEAFDEYRSAIDEGFAKLASSGLLSMSEYTKTSEAIKQFRDRLQAEKDNFPTQAVSTALRFLIKLNRELDSQIG